MHGTIDEPSQADPRATLRAAQAARRAGDPAAVPLFAAYLAANPSDLRARLDHGWACWAAGDRPAAEAIWTAARDLDPRAAEPRLALVHACRAKGDRAAAEALLAEILADHPGHPRALVEHAVVLRERSAWPGAEAAARAALAAGPGDARVLLELGRALRARGALDEALEQFRAARRHRAPPPAAVVEEARTLIGARRFEDALECLAAAEPAVLRDAAVPLLTAQALRGLGRRDAALASLEATKAPSRRVAAQIEIDRAALARPARFRVALPRPPAEAGTTLAQALAGASPGEIASTLRDATQDAHPFTAIGAARALLRTSRDAELRVAAALAEANAHGSMNRQHSAGRALEHIASENLPLPARIAARLATQRAHTALRLGERALAARLFEDTLRLTPDAGSAAAMLELITAFPAEPAPDTCLAMIEPGFCEPRLRAWLADRVAARLDPADPRLSMAGLNGENPELVECLLRRNVALARGDSAAAARMLTAAFAQQGLVSPQATGGGASLRHFSPARLAPVEGPLVTIILSAFEASQTIGGALGSVLAQSWRNIEVIVVDDASTDGTAAVVAGIAARDPRVVPLGNARNAGTYASRNRAIALARGAFVTFLDADDWMHPARIATEVAAFARPGTEVVNSCWFRLNEAGHAAFTPRAWLVYPNPSFAMFRRDALRRLGAFDHVRYSADSEMLWRARLVFGSDAVAILPQTLTIGLSRLDSLTSAPATGFDAFGFSAPRCLYNEGWAAWHEACDAQGCVPAPPAARDYALPDGMAAGEAC